MSAHSNTTPSTTQPSRPPVAATCGWTTSDDRWISLAKARRALEQGDGKGVRVAVLDSGIDRSHPRLAGLTLEDDLAISLEGGRLSVTDNDRGDVYGHGTAVAGIIHSLAPAARIGSFRVLGSFKESRTAVILEAVRQAIARGYHLLNCSFGCPGRAEFVMSYKSWIDEAYLRGVHVVAASNNSNHGTPEWPAHFPTVLSVSGGATGPAELLRRPDSLVEFALLGEDPEAAWPGGRSKHVIGSSFAAPRLAALLARLLSDCGPLPPLLAKAALLELAAPFEPAAEGG